MISIINFANKNFLVKHGDIQLFNIKQHRDLLKNNHFVIENVPFSVYRILKSFPKMIVLDICCIKKNSDIKQLEQQIINKIKFIKTMILEARCSLIQELDKYVPINLLNEILILKHEHHKQCWQNSVLPQTYKSDLLVYNLFKKVERNRVRLPEDGLWKRIKYTKKGSITGRYKTYKDSLDILRLKCSDRKRLIFQEKFDQFVEFDYSSFDIRSLYLLLGLDQPSEDIHQINAELLQTDRKTAKKVFFAWLYGSTNFSLQDSFLMFDKHYDLKKLSKYKTETGLKNIFGIEISCDDRHFNSYLVQSTSSYFFQERLIKLDRLLSSLNASSKVLYFIHDSIMIGLYEHEKHIIPMIQDVLSSHHNFVVHLRKFSTR